MSENGQLAVLAVHSPAHAAMTGKLKGGAP
jgi:hypothetical protein